jgi:hypothetical protein
MLSTLLVSNDVFPQAARRYKNRFERYRMIRLTPIPPDSVVGLKRNPETGIGYQAVSVTLKDGRHFDQAIASEGCIIQVRGCEDVPFEPDGVLAVRVNHKGWNFREWSDSRRYGGKSRAASA